MRDECSGLDSKARFFEMNKQNSVYYIAGNKKADAVLASALLITFIIFTYP